MSLELSEGEFDIKYSIVRQLVGVLDLITY